MSQKTATALRPMAVGSYAPLLSGCPEHSNIPGLNDGIVRVQDNCHATQKIYGNAINHEYNDEIYVMRYMINLGMV